MSPSSGFVSLYNLNTLRVGFALSAMYILAKMDKTEKEFLNDLLEAKLKYVTTRPCWNEPQAKPKLY